MTTTKEGNTIKTRRAGRTRSKVRGTTVRPRLSVFRSNYHTYAQLIDDTQGITLAAVSTRGMKKGTKQDHAATLGATLAKKAKEVKITQAVFDKGSYKYHGRVKAVAESARKAGLQL